MIDKLQIILMKWVAILTFFLLRAVSCDAQIASVAATRQPEATTRIFTGSLHFESRPRRPLSFYSVGVPALGIGYGVLALHKSAPEELNLSTRKEILEDHPHFLTHVDNYLQFTPGLAVIGLNIAGVKGEHTFQDELYLYGLSTLIMLGSVWVVKPIAHEQRPDHSGFSSFPSGHTATAIAGAELLRAEYGHRAPWIGVLGYAAAATTGGLRVYNNRHWVSDVVAGAAIGFLSTRIAYALNPWVEKHLLRHRDDKTVPIMHTRLEWNYPNPSTGIDTSSAH